ncbi:hypothetical protein LMG29542_04183 [Paraburkholderia humisilvae]|uniref:Uncharacterized protein n=1 Tax=Paraburkholderia humisilvae TaxID=627669 RepID=A0A6J5EA05_9BURK|nr:hypothetical protein LMG29542_04183 [Paraburkholderia humisilvae]
MGKRMTSAAFNGRVLIINLRGTDHPVSTHATLRSIPAFMRLAAAEPIDAQHTPEPATSHARRMRARWVRVDGVGLVCRWNYEDE